MKKIFNAFFRAMSSRLGRLPAAHAGAGPVVAALTASLFFTPGAALAGVVEIGPSAYRLDGGRPVTGMWEIAEKLAYAKDAAIVVVDPKAPASLVQPFLQLLQSLKVPTVLTRQTDYKRLVDQGVLRPKPTP